MFAVVKLTIGVAISSVGTAHVSKQGLLLLNRKIIHKCSEIIYGLFQFVCSLALLFFIS